MDLSQISGDRLRRAFRPFNRFIVLLFRMGLGSWGNGTRYAGYVMVIKHTGRTTGLARHTPVNYAVIDGDVYCASALGKESDWYLNLLANPEVELWLPDSRWTGVAEDVSDLEQRVEVLRRVIIASGLAGPLFGVDPKRMRDEDYQQLLETYRLIRISQRKAATGPGGPGDLAWVWPLTTFLLLALLFRKTRPKRSLVDRSKAA